MVAILEIPEFRRRVTGLTVDAYESLVEQGLAPKKGELIRGVIIEKMSKSPLHSDLCDWLRDELRRQLSNTYKVSQERPLRLTDSEPEPDLCVLHGSRADFQTRNATTALLTVEIAVSSVSEDREYALMYAEAGIPEYWIVLAEAKQVEVYRTPQGGVYQQRQSYQKDDLLVCQSLPDLRVPLAQLFG